MLKDITHVTPLENFRLFLRFEDGVEGEVDVRELVPMDGVFAPLNKPTEFEKVQVNTELGTIFWPSGADLDPDVLYAHVTRRSIALPGRAPFEDS